MTILRALTGSLRRAASGWAIACVALCALAASPASAATVQGFGPVGSFGTGGSGPGELSGPQHVAVDDATGNVLVADPGNGRVEVFQPDGAGSATYLTEFGSAAVSQPYGVAVDQSTGDVYVSGNDGVAPKIARFVSDGQPTPTYSLDATFTSPAAGAGAGQIGDFNSPIAVDPATHDLIVADRGNQRIDRFSSTGAFVRATDRSGVPGGFTTITDVAATATNVYVTDIVRDVSFHGAGRARVLRLTAQGAYDATIAQDDTPVVGGIDAATGNLVTVGNDSIDSTAQLNVYRGAGLAARADFPVGTTGSLATGVAIGGGANRHVYVVMDQYYGQFGTVSVQVFDPAPGVEADDVSSSEAHAVDLSGLVNPEGSQTSAHFEYFDGGAWTPTTPDIDVGSGTADQQITAHVTGLRPYTSYQFRVVATDTRTPAASAVSLEATARTAGEAPTVVTEQSPGVAATTASLQGTVNPLGQQSTYYFDYGTSTDYGRRSPAGTSGVAGNGYAARSVSADLSGLIPGTTYHYRLVATNASGTNYGLDQTFTTDAVDVARAYEMVSPARKSAVPVDQLVSGFKARADGNAIVYTTQKAAYDSSSSAVYLPRVLGTRSANGWASTSLDPPTITDDPSQDTFIGTIAVSDDMSRALIITKRRLGSQGVEGQGNLYVHDLATDAYQLVASSSNVSFYQDLAGTNVQAHFAGASSDLGTVVINVDVALRPGDPSGPGDNNVYSWTAATGLQLASVLPGDTAATSVREVDGQTPNLNGVSHDGARVFFTVANGGVYLRADGTTTALSVSQRPGDPATVIQATLLGASPDGRYAVIRVPPATPLTVDAPAALDNVYRYDVESGRLTYLASRVTYAAPAPATGDLYYTSLFDPSGNPTPGTNVYYEHAGNSVLVASDVSASPLYINAVSPNGRYFAFQSTDRLTSFDNGGRAEIYLYDAARAVFSCPSCRTDGGSATGDAQMGMSGNVYMGYSPRVLRDDGTLFFDTPDRLVPRDTNGARDVYESRAGTVRLVSPGTGDAGAIFVDSTPDGSNVFFVTDEQLVGQDQDNTADLYDARVGGGIPAQTPAPGRAPCGGSECREPASGPTASDSSPTMTATQQPVKPASARKPKLTLVRSSVGKTSIKITVTTSSRGRIRASGATVRATSRNATKAATYTLTVPLTQKTRTSRKKGHRVKLTVRVALSAPFASAVSIKLTRTVGK